MTIPEISQKIHLSRSAVQVSIRTIRKAGISQLNLEDFEKIIIENEIKSEIQKFLLEQAKNFTIETVHESFRGE